MKSKNLICLVGETSRGKDTVAKILQEDYNLKPVCSYTTRPMRPGEIEGREHYFITRELAENYYPEYENIVARTEINGNIYFATSKNIQDADFYIIDPNGIKFFDERHPEISKFIVYITCSLDIARERAIKRGDKMTVFENRVIDESKQFEEFKQSHNYHTVITNNGTITDLKKQVDLMIQEYHKFY